MTRADAIAHAAQIFDSGQLQRDLAELVRYPSESQSPDHAPILSDYLREGLQPRLLALGFTCALHPNPAQGGPFLIALRIEGDDLPAILSYGHGDVVKGQAAQWRDGLTPYTLVEEDARLYGRGSADNKAQHLINISALQAVLQVRGSLGFNVTLVLEMGEEIGSPGLAEMMALHRDALRADVFLASDGPRLSADRPTIFMGARGGVSFDLSVDLRAGAHHSGNWGGLLADPAIILTQALASICDARGQIRIPEWRPTSLTPEVRTALAHLPVAGSAELSVDRDWGEASLTPNERAYGWNSFTILAMTCGTPEAPLNAIAARAWARCQLRFVVGTDMHDIVPALRRHLDAQGFGVVQITPLEIGAFSATRLDPDHPWVRFVAASILQTTDAPPHILPNLAGSLPNECFAGILGLPTIWIPHSYLGCNQHAPDEHVLKSICREGLEVMAGLFWDLGDPDCAKPGVDANNGRAIRAGRVTADP